ncbi:MAG: radical SAM protein [Deltaproteobacteria bacterium]|nr:radical SAM protein [Deltaproteobacteria bacterium]
MPALLWADDQGRIRDFPDLEMTGFSGGDPVRPEPEGLVALPDYSRLFFLPGCPPVGYDSRKGQYVRLSQVKAGRRRFTAHAVAAFLAPGWVRTLAPAADYSAKKIILPMWSYTAVGFGEADYLVPAFRIEENPAWDPAGFDDDELLPLLEKRLAQRGSNRLYEHLVGCAVDNHCFAAKNLFLGRGEAPLPVSRACNASCLGCLSLQPAEGAAVSHFRLGFRPTAEEVAQVALDHLEAVPEGIVSFGQGCEGEPLTETPLLIEAIKKIRAKTLNGTINLNTNGSDPEAVARLAEAGLDSIRVSLASPRPEIFQAYVKPQGFGLKEVTQSLTKAHQKGLFTMVNYLVFPGVSDQEAEVEAMIGFLRGCQVRFLHLKNLCIDPDYYLRSIPFPDSPAIGLESLAETLRSEVKGLKLGYFNQPAAGRPGPGSD